MRALLDLWRTANRRTLVAGATVGGLVLLAGVVGLVRAVPRANTAASAAHLPGAAVHSDSAGTSAWEAVDAAREKSLAQPASGGFTTPAATDPALAGDPYPAAAAKAADAEWLECIIEPAETVEIRSPVVGRIEAIHVDRSDPVTAGMVLIELESGPERAAVELAHARAKQTGTIDSRSASAQLSGRRRDRAKKLYGKQVLSLDSREETESEAQIAVLELQQAREAQRLAELEYVHSLHLLERRSIKSPVDGVVVERAMSVGEVVDEEVILTVAQLDPLRVEVVLPADKFGTVRSGMRAAVVPELRSEDVLMAAVKIVDRVIDAASGTFRAQLEIPNHDLAIPGGLHCQVRFLPE